MRAPKPDPKALLALVANLRPRALQGLLVGLAQPSYGPTRTLARQDLRRVLGISRTQGFEVIRDLKRARLLSNGELDPKIAWRGSLGDWQRYITAHKAAGNPCPGPKASGKP